MRLNRRSFKRSRGERRNRKSTNSVAGEIAGDGRAFLRVVDDCLERLTERQEALTA